MRRARLFALTVLAALAPAPARAEPPERMTVRLSYRAPPACPEEKELRYLVSSKMRADPFNVDAKAQLTVTIRLAGSRYAGTAELREPAPAKPWVRAFPPVKSCDEAFSALAFAIAVHLGPGGPPPPAPMPPVPVPAPAAPTIEPASLPAPEHPETPPADPPSRTIRVGAAITMGLGLSPAVIAPGASLDIGVRWYRWAPLSLSLEGRAYPRASARSENGGAQVTSGLYTGALIPCAHWRVIAALELSGCARVELGALRLTSDANHPSTAVLFHAAAGLRGGIEVPLIDHLALRATGDGLLALRRYRGFVDGQPAYATPLVAASFGLGAVGSF